MTAAKAQPRNRVAKKPAPPRPAPPNLKKELDDAYWYQRILRQEKEKTDRENRHLLAWQAAAGRALEALGALAALSTPPSPVPSDDDVPF